MVLSIRELLERYYGLNDLKSALDSIGEPVTGTKEELIDRIIATWAKHYMNSADLLNVLYKDRLVLLCQDYNQNHKGTREVLVRRLITSGTIESIKPQPSSKVSVPFTHRQEPEIEPMSRQKEPLIIYIKEHKTRLSAIGGAIVFMSVLVAIASGVIDLYGVASTPLPAARLNLDAYPYPAQPNMSIINDNSHLGIQIFNITKSGPIHAELLLVVTNVGNAAAKDVHIDFTHSPDNDWLDYRTKEVLEGDIPSGGPNNALQGTLSEHAKIRIVYKFDVYAERYLREKQNDPSVAIGIGYDGKKDEMKQYQVCFDDCFERHQFPD